MADWISSQHPGTQDKYCISVHTCYTEWTAGSFCLYTVQCCKHRGKSQMTKSIIHVAHFVLFMMLGI